MESSLRGAVWMVLRGSPRSRKSNSRAQPGEEAAQLYEELVSGRSICGFETVRYNRNGKAIPVSIWAFTLARKMALFRALWRYFLIFPAKRD